MLRWVLDDKGHFFIPAPIRELLDKGKPDQIKSVMFVRGQTECLWLYSLQDWEHKLARARETLDDDKSRLFMHFIVSETTASEIDRSGRICVPRRLRELAGIDDEIIVISMYDRLEIWSLRNGTAPWPAQTGILIDFRKKPSRL
jgi:MraZ protein